MSVGIYGWMDEPKSLEDMVKATIVKISSERWNYIQTKVSEL